MTPRWLIILLLAALLLPACNNQDTIITFKNQTQCGTATVTLRHSETSNERTYTVEQDKHIDISIEHGIAYHYAVTYQRLPTAQQCEAKSGTILLPQRGDSASFALNSVTPTPEAAATTTPGQ